MKICLDYFILKNSKSLLFTHKQESSFATAGIPSWLSH